jgi:hypothetical protein
MALHTQLPIYKVAYGLFDLSTELARNMPRDFKNGLGGTLRDECLKITVLIFRANSAEDKAPHLQQLIERLQVAELILRLARDKHLVSTRQYAQAVELTQSIGKQASGWRRSALRPLHDGQGRHG